MPPTHDDPATRVRLDVQPDRAVYEPHPISDVTGDLPDQYRITIENEESYDGSEILTTVVCIDTDPDVVGGDSDYVARLQIHQRGNRAHLWHLHVNEDHRRQGIGTFLFNVFRDYVRRAPDTDRISGRIKDQGGTLDFLHTHGVPTDSLTITTVDVNDECYEAVTIGAGTAPPDLEVAEALEAFDGIPASRLLDTNE